MLHQGVMKNFRSLLLLVLVFRLPLLVGQDMSYISIDDGVLVLDNGIIHREVKFEGDAGRIATTELRFSDEDFNYMSSADPSYEFRLNIFNIALSGLNQWDFKDSEIANEESGGQEAILKFRGYGIMAELELQLRYTIYPDLPVISKKIAIQNLGDQEIMLEGIDVEALSLYAFVASAEVYTQYSRYKHIGPYEGDWNDPLLALHFPETERGVLMGNEAPGVLKRIAYTKEANDLCAGLTHPGQEYPFRKWLKTGETFTAPEVFLLLYRDEKSPYKALNFTLPGYLKKHMGLKIFEDADKPVFVYNTWNPFRQEIDALLIAELAAAAGDCGIREFVIDDGWQTNRYTDKDNSFPGYTQVGDYIVDKDKFPNGLEPVMDKIKEEGMTPGLWLSIGSGSTDSDVYRKHPEWFVRDQQGKAVNLQSPADTTMYTACLSTGWKDYIRDVILSLEKSNGLTYAKLDFATVTSAYVSNPAISACYAEDHAGHRDHPESFYANYNGLFHLFDEIKQAAPDLYIDCTFETQGKLHLIDYAFMKHAEANWLSNIEEATPAGALRVRHLAWQRTPALPASSLVAGNLQLDSDDLEFDFFSLLGTFPIMLGDIRQVSDASRQWLKSWSLWIEKMQEKYDYLSYRQDLRGYGEPAEGRWDGWQRINTENKSGGIAGVFRQGSAESSRMVTIEGLEDSEAYNVISASDGALIGSYTGIELREEGFRVKMDRPYQGKLFEIEGVGGTL